MAPFRDAVSLINRVEGYLYFFQDGRVLLFGQRFRCDVEDLGLAGQEIGADILDFRFAQRRIQEMCNALIAVYKPAKHIDLVFHQGYQRRDHYRGSFGYESRKLIAKGFPSAGGHQHKGITPVEQMVYHLLLVTLEVVVSEEFLQRAVYLGSVVLHY